jgi:nucleotide-binding universal stress UspA family protein
VLSSDVVRQSQAQLDRAAPPYYARQVSRTVYERLGRMSAGAAREEGGAIVDATFRHADDVAAFQTASRAAQTGWITCHAPPDLVVERARSATSEVDAAIAAAQLARPSGRLPLPPTTARRAGDRPRDPEPAPRARSDAGRTARAPRQTRTPSAERTGRRRPDRRRGLSETPDAGDPSMTPPILVAVDPRRKDPAPLALGLRLARLAGAPLLLASSFPLEPADELHSDFARALRAEAEHALGRARDQLAGAPGPKPPIDVALAVALSPARGLHEIAAARSALMMVIGSSSRGHLGRVSPGAVTDRLLHGAPCAVAVAPSGMSLESAGEPVRRVGCAYVDAPDGHAALATAAAIAANAAAYLRLFVVMRPPDEYLTVTAVEPMFDKEKARRHDAEAVLRHGLDAAGPSATGELLNGDPAAALASASSDLELLVCGSRGFGPLRTLLLGGTSHALVRRAGCPVLVVPRGTENRLATAFGASSAELVA